MPIKINEHQMALEVDGAVIAHAARRHDGWWEVSHWPRFFTRDQTTTALTITELLEMGHPTDSPIVVALRSELR